MTWLERIMGVMFLGIGVLLFLVFVQFSSFVGLLMIREEERKRREYESANKCRK